MRNRRRAGTGRHVARGFGLAAIVLGAGVSGACAEQFDTTRRAPAPLTIGDDLFTVLCDRVAATADPTDLEGRYSRDVCHPDVSGKYASDYRADDGDMPPKVAVMVRYRQDLIDAFNAMFPDKDHLQGDLQDLMRALVPLYDDDTLPESTRTLAAMFDAMGFNGATPSPDESPEDAKARQAKLDRAKAVQQALAHLGGRRGYRSISIGVGVAKPMLAYPKLDQMIDTAIAKLGPGGDAEPQLRKLLEITQAELDSAVIPPPRAPIAAYADRFSGQLHHPPKLTSEIVKNLLVDAAPLKADLSGPAYAPTWTEAYRRDGAGGASPELPILLRDRRGYATFATAPAGARDKDGDGLPDVDDLGRFIGKDDKPLDLGAPFKQPVYVGTGPDAFPRDAIGRALVAAGGAPLYRYGDAGKTMLHSVLVDVKTLAAEGTLLDSAHAAVQLLGPRTSASTKTDPTVGADKRAYVLSDGSTTQVAYRKFDGEQSPLTDLVYATGRFLEYPKSADYFELTRQLLRDHPTEVARVIGAALKIREIASKPEYASVMLDAKSGLWDDVLSIAVKIASEPDLMRDVLDGLTDDDVLLLSKGMAAFYAHKDQLDYDPAADSCWATGAAPDAKCDAINHPVFNVSTGAAGGLPTTPTDLGKPDDEDNRSLFQRFSSLIHDAAGVRACNKPGAKIDTKVLGISLSLPLFGTYNECQVLNVPDLGVFYLGCIAGGIDEVTGKARCLLPVTDGVVSAMKGILGDNAVDNILESSSGITGLKQVPTIEALNRLVMWRNPNKFVADLTNFIPTNACPISDPTTGHRTCASPADQLNLRQKGTIFMGEELDALKALRPIVLPFVKRRGADHTGREQLFIDLISTFHQHWSQGTNAVRCAKGAAPTDSKFCWNDNTRQYEKLISEVFGTDILPALNALQKVVKNLHVRDSVAPDGTDVMVAMVNDLINPNNAKGLTLTDRHGATATQTNDGRKIDQVTPFYLFANALIAMDAQWTGPDGDKLHALWRQSRSKLVDTFLGVEAPGGEFSKSRLSNRAIAAALPIVIDLVEDRVAEHKAKGDLSKWARTSFASSFSESLSGPLMAGIFDLQEKLYADPQSRTTISDLVAYLANQASGNDALTTTVTTTQDLLQVMGDDVNMVPVYHALAVGAAPDGATKRALDMIERVRGIETSEGWKSAHEGRRVLPKIMGNAVTPMGKDRPAPIEVLIDCVTDIHRADPSAVGKSFGADDYGSVSRNVEEFLVDPTRGLEQFYAIVKKRNDL